MKFVLSKPRGNPIVWLRELGYHFQKKNKEREELVFYRSLSDSAYPRFHLYLKIKGGNLIFNLHLDQKRPIYKGVPAHSAEYSGQAVKKEAGRIKQNWASLF